MDLNDILKPKDKKALVGMDGASFTPDGNATIVPGTFGLPNKKTIFEQRIE